MLHKLFHYLSKGLALVLFMQCTCGERALQIEPPVKALNIAMDQASNSQIFEYTETFPDDWWNLFQDEQLTYFIHTALSRNPTLQVAQATIYLAKAMADKARAPLFPSLSWGGDVLREKLSETGLIPFGIKTAGVTPVPVTAGANNIPVYFTQYETELTLAYDFDLWGKNRSLLRAAVGEMRAKIADEAFVRLELGISVAQVYFQLQVSYKRHELALSLRDNKEKYLSLIKMRVKNNLATEEEIQISESNLADAIQRLLQIQNDIAIQENTLKYYLADSFEEEIFQCETTSQPLPKIPLPIDLPLNLVARRPDIVSQLWIIESAGHQINAAKAGFYPDFSLTALFGYQTIHLRRLFEWKSSIYYINPAFNLPIFDGGRLIANLRTSEVNYDLAIFNYNELILRAAREVLASLAIIQNTEGQLQEYKNMTKNQKNLLDLVQKKVEHYLSSDLDYLVSEAQWLDSQDREVIALGNTLQAILTLIKALGGGYGNCSG